MTKFLNISTDSTLVGNSDETVVSEKAIKAYADTKLKSGDNVSELVNDAGYLVMGDLTGFVTRTTAQTISGLKTFTVDIVLSGTTSIKNTTSGVSYTMLYRDTSGIHVGTSTQALLLAGSGTRPTFNGNNVAMSSDIPTAVSQLTNDSGFITNAVNDLQNYTLTSALATVATSGSYNDLSDKPTIPTVNNPTITITQGGVTKGSFTLNQASGDTIALDAGGGGGSVAIDNSTITKNSSDEIQAVAVIDQNTGIAKTWTGTMAEYDAIVTKDPETEYIITDDIGGSATEIGQITEALNNKADKNDAVGYCSFNTGTRVKISTTDQVANKNGWLIGDIDFSGNNKSCSFYINSIRVGKFGYSVNNGPWFSACLQIPIKQGQTYRFSCDGTVQANNLYFYPND